MIKTDEIPEYAIYNLALAVINRAVIDYHQVLKKGDMSNVTRTELERFFKGEFFALATDNYPPDLFTKKIGRGDCCVTEKHECRRTGQLNRKDNRKTRFSLL